MWEKPFYLLNDRKGKKVAIDVTSSAQPGLPPNDAVREFIGFLKRKRAKRVLDFGAGALRFTFPLLDAGFQVCAVEFEEQFAKPSCAEARKRANKDSNFSSLIWPREFRKDKTRFDAAMLCYVLQIMPIPDERDLVLRYIANKLRDDSYLLYMSRYGQMDSASQAKEVSDGIYRWKEREYHTFYREFTADVTHELFQGKGFKHIKSLAVRGTEQIYVYVRGSAAWI